MKKDIRKLIAKEIELGFLRVPAKLKRYFPKDKSKISFIINNRIKKLSYNPKYGRITGLTDFYRKNNASPNDVVEVDIKNDDKIELIFKRFSKKENDLVSIDEIEAKEIINVSELSSQAKGNIVEQRIAELILLYGQGLLNVYKPIADIEGIDLIIVKRGIFQPIFVQVKSRYNLRGNQIQVGVKERNFISHYSFFIVVAYFNPKEIDIADYLIFIPSEDFKKKANIINRNTNKATYVLTAPLNKEYNGRFADYIIKKENLVNKIFEEFKETRKYLR